MATTCAAESTPARASAAFAGGCFCTILMSPASFINVAKKRLPQTLRSPAEEWIVNIESKKWIFGPTSLVFAPRTLINAPNELHLPPPILGQKSKEWIYLWEMIHSLARECEKSKAALHLGTTWGASRGVN